MNNQTNPRDFLKYWPSLQPAIERLVDSEIQKEREMQDKELSSFRAEIAATQAELLKLCKAISK